MFGRPLRFIFGEYSGPKRKEEIRGRLEDIRGELAGLRKEVRLCDDILVRSVRIREKLRKIEELEREQNHQPERTGREHGRWRQERGR